MNYRNIQICPKCHTHKFDSSKYQACYECSMKARGSVLCKYCGNKYHDPKFPSCYDCNHKNSDYQERQRFND